MFGNGMAQHKTLCCERFFSSFSERDFLVFFLFANPSAHTLTARAQSPMECGKMFQTLSPFHRNIVPLCYFFFGWDCLPRAFFASLLFDERHNRRLRCWIWGWESFFHGTHRDESMREDWRKKQTVNHNFPLKLLYIFGLKNLRLRWRRMSSNISS